MRKTRHWKLFRRRMLLEATMGCRYWRWHHWGCRLSNLSCRYHAVAPAMPIPCTLHLGPDIHRLLPASPISRLAFYIPIKLNELVQVIQKILSSGCPVVAWRKIISPPINFFIIFIFLMIIISMIIIKSIFQLTMPKSNIILTIFQIQYEYQISRMNSGILSPSIGKIYFIGSPLKKTLELLLPMFWNPHFV